MRLIKMLFRRQVGFIREKSNDFQMHSVFMSEAADFTTRVCNIFLQYQMTNVPIM